MSIINIYRPQFGAKAFFVPDGTTVETETYDRDNPPSTADLTVEPWMSLGCLGNATTIKPNREGGSEGFCFNETTFEHESKGMQGEKRFVSGVLELQDISDWVIATLIEDAADYDDVAGTFTPGSRTESVKGWLAFPLYVRGSGKIVERLYYVELMIDGDTNQNNDSEATTVSVNWKQLKAAGEIGTISDPEA